MGKGIDSKVIDTTAELVPVETRAEVWIVCWTEAVSGYRCRQTMITEPAAIALAKRAPSNMLDIRLYRWIEPPVVRISAAAPPAFDNAAQVV